jgi:hypothetical protein
MDIRITRQSLRDAKACYDDNEIAALIPEAGVNLDEGLALYVPVEDKHWVLCYAAGVPDRILREHSCWCARQSLNAERAAGREPDPRSWHAVEVAERFARGEATAKELESARADAARAASADAWAARARAAAASAAEDSAGAWAARAARWAASAASASVTAWAKQLSDLVERIRNYEHREKPHNGT